MWWEVSPILAYFDTYRFRMEYLKVKDDYVAQVKCVESPTFYFTGNFGSIIF